MQLQNIVLALVGMSAMVEGSALRGRFHGVHGSAMLEMRQNKGTGNKGTGNGASAAAAAATNGGNAAAANGNSGSLTLDTKAVQTGSQQDGSKGAAAGQAKSITDNANFINFCSGKTLTNGLQQQGGSCNGIVMGEMPASSKMVATVITSPVPGKEPAANTDFDVTVQMTNMQLGTFTNPDSTYYAAPQQLNGQGQVIGHTHVVVQDLGNSLTPTTPPDASKFAFFKGINDAGNGQGKLTATVAGGLPAGNYRICTMAGSSNHQPLLMPIAQRGAQDDCLRITIANGGGNANNANKGGAAAANGNANANKGGAAAANGNAAANKGGAAAATGNAAANKGGAAAAKGNAAAGAGAAGAGGFGAGGFGAGGFGGAPTGNSAPNSGSTGQASNTNTGTQPSASQASNNKNNPNNSNSGATASPSTASSSSPQGCQGTKGQTQKTGQNNNKGSQGNVASSSPTGASQGIAGASPSGSPLSSSSAGNGSTGSSSSSSSPSSSITTEGNSSSSGSIGGIKAPAVTDSGDSTRPFSVNGNTFVNQSAAIQRACAIQNNQCADAVNSGKAAGSTVADCNAQEATCNAQGGA